MELKNLKLKYDEIHSFGQRLVKTHFGILMAMKMYSLGGHLLFPVHLSLLRGNYNCTEKVKHRKR